MRGGGLRMESSRGCETCLFIRSVAFEASGSCNGSSSGGGSTEWVMGKLFLAVVCFPSCLGMTDYYYGRLDKTGIVT